MSHHLRPARRPHWHVDFLRRRARPVAIWFRVGRTAREHVWARTVAADPRAVETLAGFGASDCRCDSHLFRFEVQPEPLPALGADVVQIAAV